MEGEVKVNFSKKKKFFITLIETLKTFENKCGNVNIILPDETWSVKLIRFLDPLISSF